MRMLQLSQSFIGRPIMSLRTGRPVAMSTEAIINPNNLKIEGFYCVDSIDKKKRLVLLYQDIRDVIPQGIVIDDHDVLAEPSELVRLQEVIGFEFTLIGKPVLTENKERIGKVNDYAVDVSSMFIQKIYVTQSLMKSLTGGSLSVDRSRIIEITARKIVIQNPLQGETIASTAAIPA